MKLDINKLSQLIVIVGAIVILFLAIMGMVEHRNKKNFEFMYMLKNTDWKKMIEKEADYTMTMYAILDTFSKKKIGQCLTKDQRIIYARENLKMANTFGWGKYDVPVIHQLESSFDPFQEHLFGEIGMGGIMYSTAINTFAFCQAYMPRRLWERTKFNLRSRKDLKDYINSLKMSYMILWYGRTIFKGYDLWSVSFYHFGGSVWKRWRGGEGEFPIKFIYYTKHGKMVLDCRKYFYAWRFLRQCYESGDINGAHKLWEKYRKDKRIYNSEVVKYRRAVSVIRRQEKIIKEYEFYKNLYDKQVEKIKESNKQKKKVLRQVKKEGNEKGWVKELWQKFKDKL